jgi:hypothetical protein
MTDSITGFTRDEYNLDLKNCKVSNEFICPICQCLFVNATELWKKIICW